MRFVFDAKSGAKKKNQFAIEFPTEVDMSPYAKNAVEGEPGWMYDLRAVLLHRGKTANMGHYIARIYDET